MRDSWTPRCAHRDTPPVTPEAFSVPTKHRVWLNDDKSRLPSRPCPTQPDPEHPIHRSEPWLWPLPLIDTQLMAECCDLQEQVSPAAEKTDEHGQKLWHRALLPPYFGTCQRPSDSRTVGVLREHGRYLRFFSARRAGYRRWTGNCACVDVGRPQLHDRRDHFCRAFDTAVSLCKDQDSPATNASAKNSTSSGLEAELTPLRLRCRSLCRRHSLRPGSWRQASFLRSLPSK